MPSAVLNVTGVSSVGWLQQGSSPFLDAADGTNYLYIYTPNLLTAGLFDLEDLAPTIDYVTSVTVRVRVKHENTSTPQYNYIIVDVFDGFSWTLGAGWIYITSTNWQTKTLDVTSILNTIAKVNGAKLAFRNGWSYGGEAGYIDYADLLVSYSSATGSGTAYSSQGRVEVHHGPPVFFDDHFESGWSAVAGSISSDGDILTLSGTNPSAQRTGLSIASSTYPNFAIRIKSYAGTSWAIQAYYDGAWYNVLTGQTGTGLIQTTLISGKTITGLRINHTGTELKVDYISVSKIAVVIPLNPPTVQDIIGTIDIELKLNACATASLSIDNTPDTLGNLGPYTGMIGSKDIIIIWAYTSGQTFNESRKLFGGIIVEPTDDARNTSQRLIKLSCLDHGWELQKPPSLFSSRYSSTIGKTILVAAVNLCSYLSSALVDDASQIASLHSVDYSEEGKETTPFVILEELAPKCVETGTGDVGFDWRVTPSGVLDLFPRNSISTGLEFDNSDFEKYTRKQDFWRCWNSVKIYGARGKTYPSPTDTFSDGDQNGSVSNNPEVSTNQTTYQLLASIVCPADVSDKQISTINILFEVKVTGGQGAYKITYQKQGQSEQTIVQDVAVTNTTYESKSEPTVIDGNWENTVTIRFYYLHTTGDPDSIYARNHQVTFYIFTGPWIHGGSGEALVLDATNKTAGNQAIRNDVTSKTSAKLNFSFYKANGDVYVDAHFFTGLKFSLYIQDVTNVLTTIKVLLSDNLGVQAYKYLTVNKGNFNEELLDVGYSVTDWFIQSGFDWTNLSYVEIYTYASASSSWFFCVDNLYLLGRRFSGASSNSGSIASYGTLRRPPEVDEALNSDSECSYKADGVLALYQTPVVSLSNLKLQLGNKFNVGETAVVTEIASNQTDTVRIVSVHHSIGTEWDSIYEFSNEPVEVDYVFKHLQEQVKLALRKT